MNYIKFLIRLTFIVAIPAFVALVTFLLLRQSLLRPLRPNSTEKITVEIAPGKTFNQICNELHDKGVLRHPWSLELLARFKKADTRINAGEYELSPAMGPREILAKLMSGEVVKRSITIKEGQSVWEIGKAIEAAGIISAAEFNGAVADPNLLTNAGVSASSFEGYLFPETYFFSRPITVREIIWKMLEEGEQHWKREFSDQADKLRMSRHEILTLASIIEKESGNVEEQPLISAVFHNRLNQGMKLQSDPTVIYGIKNFDGNLTKEHLLDANNMYNTYLHFGLPPGPICNPGDTAIKAALFPAEATYLFFVADGKGKHVFSTTLEEHNAAVNRYQKNPEKP